MAKIPRIPFLLFLLWPALLHAQSPLLETISIEQGLSQGFITGICQDSEGFLWFGTNSGLNRYDGYEFLVFKNDPYDPFSLPDNQILAICEAGDFLFVASQAGASLFHRRTRRFFQIAQTMQLSAYPVAKCQAENAHTVWLSLYQEGAWRLYRCSWPKEAAERLPQEPFLSKEVRFERIYGDHEVTDFDLSADRKTLWLAVSEDQVLRKRLPDGAWEAMQVPVPRPRGSSLLALGNDELGILDGADRIFARLEPLRAASGTAPRSVPASQGYRMRLLNFDAQRRLLWVGRHKEVWGFDMSAPLDSLSRGGARYVLPLPEGAISAYTDRNGILWIGTDTKGVVKFNPNTGLFKNYCVGQSVFCPPLADLQGNIWIGNLGNKHYNQVLSRATGRLHPYPVPELAGSKYESRGVSAPDGTLWLTAVASDKLPPKLIHYDPSTGKREVFQYPLPFYDAVPALLYDAETRVIWTAYAKKLVRFEVATAAFSVFELEALPDRLPWVHACVKTSDGSLWLAYDVGLLRASPHGISFSFQLYRNDPSDRNSLAGNYVKSLLVDPADGMVLWIGTAGYGLCRFDLRTQRFAHYNTRNGLSDDVVYGIGFSKPCKVWSWGIRCA